MHRFFFTINNLNAELTDVKWKVRHIREHFLLSKPRPESRILTKIENIYK